MNACMYVFGNNPNSVIDKFKVYELEEAQLIKTTEEAIAEGREIYKHFHNVSPSQYPHDADSVDDSYLLQACASVYNGTITPEGIVSKHNPHGLYKECIQGGEYEFILDSGVWQADRMSIQNIDWSCTPEPNVWVIDGQIYSSETSNFREDVAKLSDDTIITAFQITV